MGKSILFILLGGFFILNIQSQTKLDIKLDSIFKTTEFVGLGISVYTQDSVLYQNAFGFADKESKVSYTVNTVQPIASISKTLIAVALMKAQEMGKLQLDEDINKYLPFRVVNPYCPDKVITIRHLATHTSGIKDTREYEKGYVFSEKIQPIYNQMSFGLRKLLVKKYVKLYNGNQEMGLEEFLSSIYVEGGKWYKKSNFSKNDPGEKEQYSNCGATLAAMIVEKATGMDYRDFVKEYILTPLDMKSSCWSMLNETHNAKSSLYLMQYKIPYYTFVTYPDGAFVTNISDFTKYMMAMLKGYRGNQSILDSASCREMFTYQIKKEFRSGIFWEIKGNSIGHNGSDPGVLTFAYFYKEKDLGFVIFTNTSEAKDYIQNINKMVKALKESFYR